MSRSPPRDGSSRQSERVRHARPLAKRRGNVDFFDVHVEQTQSNVTLSTTQFPEQSQARLDRVDLIGLVAIKRLVDQRLPHALGMSAERVQALDQTKPRRSVRRRRPP